MDSRYRTNVPASHTPAQTTPTPSPAPTAQPVKPAAQKPKSKRNRLIMGIAAALLVVGLILGGLWLVKRAGFFGYIDNGKYQAVFLTNGQVYFGKLKGGTDDYMRLTDIFYLQTTESTDSQNPQQTSSDNSNVQLIKLGSEIHGPTDEMIISRDQILFYENIKGDGTVAKSIDKYHTDNK